VKKTGILLCICLNIFLLFACNGSSIYNGPYKGKEIQSIEYISTDYNGGFTYNRKIDFESNGLYGRNYFPHEDENVPLELIIDLNPQYYEEFINKIYNLGLLNLKEKYSSIIDVIDGGRWDLIITYKDGTTKESFGVNSGPYQIMIDSDYVFYDLFNEEFFGRVDDSYKRPSSLLIYYSLKKNNTLENHFTALKPTNFIWKNNQINDIDNFEFVKTHKLFDYNENYEYNFSLWFDGNNEIPKKISIQTYSLDKTPIGDIVSYEKNDVNSFSITLEKNLIYLFTVTYDKGIVEYPLSTEIERFTEVPKDFDFEMYWKNGNVLLGYSLKENKLYSSINEVEIILTEEQLLDIYKKIYQCNLDETHFACYAIPKEKTDRDTPYFNISYYYKSSGSYLKIIGAKYQDDVTNYLEGQEIMTVFNDIFNKYFLEYVSELGNLDPDKFQIGKFSNGNHYVILNSDNTFEIYDDNEIRTGTYYIKNDIIYLISNNNEKYFLDYEFKIVKRNIAFLSFFSNLSSKETDFYEGKVFSYS